MDDFRADLAICGTVRLGPQRWARRELLISDGTIVAVSSTPGSLPARRRIDCGASWVLPGMVDAHVHCLSEPAEGIASVTTAAAVGGVTTIVEMPFDATGPINSADRLVRKTDLVAEEARVDVALLGTVSPEGGWSSIEKMAALGACGFKASLFHTDSYRFPRLPDAALRSTMSAVAQANSTICVHAENDSIIQDLLSRPEHRDSLDPLTHGETRPPVTESLGVLTAMEIAEDTGARLHMCHLSLPRSVALARWYREHGLDVSVESCPHYLFFTEDAITEQRARLKINPPIRDAAAREGLWQAIADASVDIVASDHAPWHLDHKQNARILGNHSGAPGVETIYPTVLAEAARRGKAYLERVIDSMTVTPARRYGLDAQKGRLEPGYDADIVVFDPAAPWVIDERTLHGKAGWSPYHGHRQHGRIATTLVRGKIVWDGETVLADSGTGRFVPRGNGE